MANAPKADLTVDLKPVKAAIKIHEHMKTYIESGIGSIFDILMDIFEVKVINMDSIDPLKAELISYIKMGYSRDQFVEANECTLRYVEDNMDNDKYDFSEYLDKTLAEIQDRDKDVDPRDHYEYIRFCSIVEKEIKKRRKQDILPGETAGMVSSVRTGWH